MTSQACNTQSCGGTPTTGSTVTIYAAGTAFGGVYPSMDLIVNGTAIASWSDIRGIPQLRVFNKYTFVTPTKITSSSQVRVSFTNDASGSKEDRNLRIDKIVIDGVTYQSEARTTYSTGSWLKGDGCASGYKKSEWLHCNGYFRY